MNPEDFIYETQLQIKQVFDSQDPELLNVCFEVDAKKIYADKLRLSVISSTFKSMLAERWTSKNDDPIQISNYKFDDFRELLSFIYSGECKLTDDNVFAILDMAEFYQISYLKQLCDAHLSKMKINMENIIEFLELSNKYSSLKQTKRSMNDFVSTNFVLLLESTEFLDAKKSVVEEFFELECSGKEPEAVFKAVYQWAENQAIKKEESLKGETLNAAIKAEISGFLPLVQFKEMSIDFLHKFVVKRGFIFSSFNELSDILDNANFYRKVTITNSKGKSIHGFMPNNSQFVEGIRSLKNQKSDNDIRSLRNQKSDNDVFVKWSKICSLPSIHGLSRNSKKGTWYLVISIVGDVSLKLGSLGWNDYILAEMYVGEGGFEGTTKCTIEIE